MSIAATTNPILSAQFLSDNRTGKSVSGRNISFPGQSHAGCRAALQEMTPTVNTTRTPYEILRVRRNASLTEIKSAYRSLAKVYHPDCCDGGRDFIDIHNAYSTLSDPESRAVYDLRGRRRSGFYPTRRWETDQCW